MLVIYRLATKKVEGYSMSSVKEPTWDDVKPYYLPNEDFGHLTVSDSLFDDILQNQTLYHVDDSGAEPILVRDKAKLITMSCAEQLIDPGTVSGTRKYVTTKIGQVIGIEAVFTDSNGNSWFPVGTLTLRANYGILSADLVALNGTVDRASFTWQMPGATVTSTLSANVLPHDKREFSLRRLAITVGA
jgi:hypothetical protein